MSSVAGGPQTLIGRWLRARLLGHTELADLIQDEARRTLGKWEVNPERFRSDLAVIREVAELLIRRRFGRDTDVRVITGYVYERQQVAAGLPLLVGEAVIRRALGEEIDFSDITSAEEIVTCMAFSGSLFSEVYRDPVLGPDEDSLDELLVKAERRVMAKGIEPALASVIMTPPVNEG